MSIHRQTYLDELTQWCGQGDFITSEQCSDCIAWGHPTPSSGRYRCHECFQPDLTCQSCCLKRHKTHPFHRIEVGHLFLHCSNTYICILDVDQRCVRQGVLEINGIEGTIIFTGPCSPARVRQTLAGLVPYITKIGNFFIQNHRPFLADYKSEEIM